MDIEKDQHHGFRLLTFRDFYDKVCSIQKSSLATQDAIWFGVEAYPVPRMHLTQEMVRELLPILQRFADTGELD